MGIASLLCGIFSVILCWFGGVGGIVLGIPGIILGALQKRRGSDGKATAGLILSIVGVAIGAFAFIFCAGVIGAASSEYYYYY